MEQAWRVDEGIRMQETLRRHERREYWRKRILDIEEHGLIDYDRPLKRMQGVRIPLGLRIKTLLKYLIP